jgi:MFS family permease
VTRPTLSPLLRVNRPFRSFWVGQTISLFGDQVSLLAIPLLAALELDAGPAQMGLLAALELAPNLLFSIPLGAWADRRASRRRLLVVADLGRAALLLTVPIAALLGVLSLGQLYVVAFAVGSLSVLFAVAYQVVFVALVDRKDYVGASSLLNGSRAASVVAGNGVAGLLVQLVTAPLALLADVGSFLASAVYVGRAEAPEPPPEPEESAGGLAAGARFIARTPLMRASLLAAATFSLFNAAFWALLVLYATKELGIGPGSLGLALAVAALGGVIGTAVASRLSARLGLGNALIVAFVLAPAPLVLVPLASGSAGESLVFLAVAEFASGMGVMILDVCLGALFAAIVPDGLRSRVSGAYLMVNFGVRPVGALAGGLLATAIGLRPTLWIASIGAIAGVLWLLPSPMPRLRGLPKPAATPTT